MNELVAIRSRRHHRHLSARSDAHDVPRPTVVLVGDDDALARNDDYYGDARVELQDLVAGSWGRVLDVGCAYGALGADLLEAGRATEVVGIEVDRAASIVAGHRLTSVHVGDAESIELRRLGPPFDTVVLGDVVEHLRDPWAFLGRMRDILVPGGVVIASIPNVRHLSVVYPLVVHGRWDYQEAGIMDRTHLRFLTRRNATELFLAAGFDIVDVVPYFRGPRSRTLHQLAHGLTDEFVAQRWMIVGRSA